jgi:hypothetical protein
MLALLVFPLARRCGHVGLGKQDGLLLWFGLGGRFLNDLQRLIVCDGFGCRLTVFDRLRGGGLFNGGRLRWLVGTAGDQQQRDGTNPE